jgi:hypothetical protein
LEDLSIDGRLLLKWILKEGVRVWSNSSHSGHTPVASSCEHPNEPSSSVTKGELLDQLYDYKLLKKVLLHEVCLKLHHFVPAKFYAFFVV